jgi:hypothetical protein
MKKEEAPKNQELEYLRSKRKTIEDLKNVSSIKKKRA